MTIILLLYIYILLLVDTGHCFPIPNGSQAILLETSNDSLPWRAQGEHIRLRVFSKKQRRLNKESAAAILKYLKNMFQKLSHASRSICSIYIYISIYNICSKERCNRPHFLPVAIAPLALRE